MTEELRDKLHKAQLRDVSDMQALREAAAAVGNANQACSAVLGGRYNLSKEVAEGLERGANA